MVWASYHAREEAIAFQIQEDALEQMTYIQDAITAAFDDLDFIVESLDKPTAGAPDKIVG